MLQLVVHLAPARQHLEHLGVHGGGRRLGGAELPQLGLDGVERGQHRCVRRQDLLRLAVAPILDTSRPDHAVDVLLVVLDADERRPELRVGVEGPKLAQVVWHEPHADWNALRRELRLH
eukprot:6256971-Prymnesium_polylepis.1